jgi:hypothetical protein
MEMKLLERAQQLKSEMVRVKINLPVIKIDLIS